MGKSWFAIPQQATRYQLDQHDDPNSLGYTFFASPDSWEVASLPRTLNAAELATPHEVVLKARTRYFTAGRFQVRLELLDSDLRVLKSAHLASFDSDTPVEQARRFRRIIGIDQGLDFPADTRFFRFVVAYQPGEPPQSAGGMRGELAVLDLEFQPYRVPAQPTWPPSLVARAGDLETRFESRSFWTPYRLDYRGTRIGLDRFGSHWGTVVRFADVGFIGSGHVENDDEHVTDLGLWVDGAPIAEPTPTLSGNTIRLEKTSRIRTLELRTTVTLQPDRLIEQVKLQADEPTPVGLIYHFMHPWTPTADAYRAKTRTGEIVAGKFSGDRGNRVDQPVRWSAIFDSSTKTGVVTRVLQTPADPRSGRVRYWDIPDVYRKHYFVTFLNQTVPAKTTFSYEVETIPFQSTADDWSTLVDSIGDTGELPEFR